MWLFENAKKYNTVISYHGNVDDAHKTSPSHEEFVKAGTVHLDNFCIAENFCPGTDMEEQNEARNKMIDYIQSLGIDVTSEYTYREHPLRADANYHPVTQYYKNFVDDVESKNGKMYLFILFFRWC